MKGLWKGFWDKVKDIRARWEYGVAGLFSDDPVSEEFFAITRDQNLSHPGVRAITEAAASALIQQ